MTMIENAPQQWMPPAFDVKPTAPPMSEKFELPDQNPDFVEPVIPLANPHYQPEVMSVEPYISPFTEEVSPRPLKVESKRLRLPSLREAADSIEFYQYKVEQIAFGVFEGLASVGSLYAGMKIWGNIDSSLGKYTGWSCLAISALLGWDSYARTTGAWNTNKRDFYFRNVIDATNHTLRTVENKLEKISARHEALRKEIKIATKKFEQQSKGRNMTPQQLAATRRQLQNLNDSATQLLSAMRLVRV